MSFLLLVFIYGCSTGIESFIKDKNFEDAEEYCEQQEGEKQQECYLKLADAYFKYENYEKAKSYYEKVGNKEKVKKCEAILSKKQVKIVELNLKNEYVLIRNTASIDISLTKWKITDNEEKNVYIFPEYTLIAGKTLQIQSGNKESRKKIDEKYEYIEWTERDVWNNTGDTAFLYDEEGILISELYMKD
jgi:hypothetical protein